MFAMDCAAMTRTGVSNFIEDGKKKRTILISDILPRDSVTTQECPRSWIALEETRHFFGGAGVCGSSDGGQRDQL